MKKFKKLAAVMVAVVTLMATAINACAAVCNGETYHWFNQIKSSYYVANNTLHYSDFFSWENNYIYFANMDKGLMEGNVIFSIDISNPNATSERTKYHSKSAKAFREQMEGYLSKLHLLDNNDKYIGEGKYPLTVQYNNNARGYINIIFDTNWRTFSNVDISNVNLAYRGSYSKDKAYMEINCVIKDIHVLPGYTLTLEECNSSSPVILSRKVDVNRMNNWDKIYDGDYTIGGFKFYNFPYNKYKGKTFDVKINGVKVGKISLASNQCKITIIEK